ncbi:hypothetical protein [Catellatospora citrea]|uniref:Uncharacterized protein n=1 Tax=Catellatospora citrea TaxID=53366 RepID=A0A8J3KGZ6_9ACTN|nr:hypothetical protein [Catellatospora citrea]RKE05609.1 hypothetical protein C8E86_0413 [Catellatospora citrea]GIF96960.1 hypothetical protein Cci01nite_20540 [Catellatospora citrea]
MTDPDGLADKRAKWQRYFEGRLTGSDAEIRAATDAAMDAIRRRADVNGVIEAGLAAARQFRATGSAPTPPAAPPRTQSTAAPRVPTSAPRAASRGPVGTASSGIVNGFQQRQEMIGRTYFTVWNFRLERSDEAGRPLPAIPVEMKGRYFNGAISNGDLVDVGRSFTPGKLVRTNRVRNATVGVDVSAVGRQFRVLRGVFIAIFVVIALCIFGLIISVMLDIQSFDLPDPQLPE